jgi:subtilisin family serine protease
MPSPPGIHDPALVEELRTGPADEELSVIVRLSDPNALPPGARVVTRFGDIATVRVERDHLQELAESATVRALEASRNLRPSHEDEDGWHDDAIDEGDESESHDPSREPSLNTRRPDGVQGSGKNILVAVLDWGVDPCHPAFQHEDGSTRIISLWDQRGTAGIGPGNRWGYGRILTSEDIDRALLSDDPYRELDYHPADAGGSRGAHGTHVLDIAAGSGLAGGMPGVAPEADLVFVHLARTTDVLGEGNLGDSASVLEALDHVFSIAGERPCVVNMSVGAHGGPHDGETLVELGLDRAVSLAPGRAVVNSAGNYRTRRAHTMGRVTPGEPRTIPFQVPHNDTHDSELEVFYPSIDQFTVEVVGPDETVLARLVPGQDSAMVVAGTPVGHVYHRVRYGTSGDHHIDVLLKPDAPGGVWSLRLSGESVHDGRYHAWIERDRGLQPTFLDPDVVTSSTTGTLCNARLSLTCGCVNAYVEPPILATFSSGGPTRDGRVKPEVVAPGSRIRAARSTPRGAAPGARYVSKSGTSMAAPHLAGAIALMYEAAGVPLEIYDTRALLFASADPSPFFAHAFPGPDLHRFGYGMLDIVAAEQAARDFGRESGAEKPKDPDELAAWEVAEEPAVSSVLAVEDEAEPETTESYEPAVLVEEPAWPESLDDGGDVTEPIRRSDTLRNDLARVSWIGDPGDLKQHVFDSLGIDADRPLTPLSDATGTLLMEVEPGDLLVRSAPVAGGQYTAVIVSERPESAWALLDRGVPIEPGGGGWFVQVIEVPFGGGSPQTIGRRLTDGEGRVPRYQTVLRAADPSVLDSEVSPILVDQAPDLEESLDLPDIFEEMKGLRCRLLRKVTAERAGAMATFASGKRATIDEWNGTEPEAKVDGFPVPKLDIDPDPEKVTSIHQYTLDLPGQRIAVGAVRTDLDKWNAKEASYQTNRGTWEAEKKRLDRLLKDKTAIYSNRWVRQMMYNRFDKAIDTWTKHYNTKLSPATDLDPKVVKSMAYQESRMGTFGCELIPQPWDWKSPVCNPINSRFNILQATDSWGPQQWLMMKEMAPAIFTKYRLDKLEARTVWLGMTAKQYWAHADFMEALKEFFAHRKAGKNLMGVRDVDLPADYDFWIRAAVRWLFEKYLRLNNPTWSEAVRAYNGSGPRAERYRKEVMERAAVSGPYEAEENPGEETTLAEWPVPTTPVLNKSAILTWKNLTRITATKGDQQVFYVVTGAPLRTALAGYPAMALFYLEAQNTNTVVNHENVVTKHRLLRVDSKGRTREAHSWISRREPDLEDETSRVLKPLPLTSDTLTYAYQMQPDATWSADSPRSRLEVEYHWREYGPYYNRTGLDFMLVAPIEYLFSRKKLLTPNDIELDDVKYRNDFWIHLRSVKFTPELRDPFTFELEVSSSLQRHASRETTVEKRTTITKEKSSSASNTFRASVSAGLERGGSAKVGVDVLELGLQQMVKLGGELGFSRTTTNTSSETVAKEFAESLRLTSGYSLTEGETMKTTHTVRPPEPPPTRTGPKSSDPSGTGSQTVGVYLYPVVRYYEVPYVRFSEVNRFGQATKRTEGTVAVPYLKRWILTSYRG